VRAVEVVGEPARPALGRGLVNDGDEQAAEEVPDAEDAEEQGQPEAARSIGYMVDGGGELGETGGGMGRWAAGETRAGGWRRRTWSPVESGADAERLVLDESVTVSGFFRYVLSSRGGFNKMPKATWEGLNAN
jgi:hypothetical protein